MRMLSDSDLHAIGVIVEEKVDKKLEPVLEAVRDGFEEMDRRWDEKLGLTRHEIMDHTDRTVQKTVGDLRVELKGDMGELRQELKGDMVELRKELKDDMGELRQELKDDMGELRTELKGDIGSLRSELRERDLIG